MKVTQQALAAHLFCAPETIKTYEQAGLIKRGKTGYDQDECRKLILRHLRDLAGGRQGNAAGMNLTAEKARRERSQSEKNEFALRVLQGAYVLTEEVGQEVDRAFGIVREQLLAIPGRSADKCADSDPKRREAITFILNADIAEALNALSSPDDVVRKASKPIVLDPEAPAETEPDRVGRSKAVRRSGDKHKSREVED
jgi:hypothetical protein